MFCGSRTHIGAQTFRRGWNISNDLRELLTEQRFASISEWGLLALLSRHAQRYRPTLQSVFQGNIGPIINSVEYIASKGLGDPLPLVSKQIEEGLDTQGKNRGKQTSAQRNAVETLEQMARCLRATWGESREAAFLSCQRALRSMVMIVEATAQESMQQIDEDIETLVELTLSTSDTELRTGFQLWRNGNPDKIAPTVFARYARFDYRRMIEVVPHIDARIVSYFRQYPERLHDLTGRQFEELVASIFDGFGFSVELTAATGDYGRDVIAIDEGERLKYLIECKRWKRNVGIAVVQRLHGVARGEGATKGIIATTAGFTRQAKRFLSSENVRWQLDGRDFDGIKTWLEHYDRIKMARLSEPQITWNYNSITQPQTPASLPKPPSSSERNFEI